ncbi:MAG: hypothetical protein JWL83_1818, partial [Actinomycetia bacterium]|nr:hypothetical protein [Actinomycetes bacterium]
RGPFSVGEERRFAPRGDGEEPFVALARLLRAERTTRDARAAAIDLARPQVHELQRRLRYAALARCLHQGLNRLHGVRKHDRRVAHSRLHHVSCHIYGFSLVSAMTRGNAGM